MAADDARLSKVAAELPSGWKMALEGGQLSFVRDGDVFVLAENRINAPMSRETDAEREARVRKYGTRGRARIVFRLEPRWTKAQWDGAKQHNRDVWLAVEALPAKHRIVALYDARLSRKGRAVYVAKTDDDRRRVRAFEQESETLLRGLKPLPSYESEQWSLFAATREGAEDDLHLVAPHEASREVFQVETLLQETCPLPAR